MRGIRNVKKKHLIFGIFFIVVFFVVIMHAYNSYSATKEYFLGDTNLDNKINLSDELVLLRHIYAVKSGKNTKWRLTGDALVNADINEDKTINISDVLNIKRYLIAQKDESIAEKHADWNNLCKKIVKEESDIVKTYTLTVKPENKQYMGENQNTITITAPELSYNVSFEGNGGSKPNTQKSIRGFENWTLSGSGKIGNKNLATTTYTFENGDAVLTANYKKEGKLIVLPNSQKDKYRIEGWYDSKELNNKIGNAGDTYSPTQDIKLYAKWVEQGEEPIRNIELNKSSVIMVLSSNKTEQLVAKISQTDNNDNTNFTWTSSNTNVATVSNDGLVTGEANGETVIIVKDDSGAVATCKVTVQTSPTNIYFKENKTDKTKYLSVKKGASKATNIVIEPSTANVETEITYSIISGNNKVASINSTTGIILGKQAGVVKIKAKTANGKIAYIYLNVKIGNKAFDTTKVSNQNYTKSSLLYSRSVDIGAGFSPQISSYMQSFDIDSKGNIYYGSIGSGTRKDSFITYASKNKVSNNYMKITYFGHQSAIDMEENGTERYVWVEALSYARGDYGYTGNFIISRMKYIKGASYKYAMGTVKEKDSSGKQLKTYKNPNGQNFIYINVNGNMIRGMHASVDEKNRLLAIFYGKQILIYDLDEAIAIANADYKQEVDTDDGKRIVEFQAKNLNSIKKLTTITIQSDRKNIDKDILSYAMQGFDLDGDYVYLAEGFNVTKTGEIKSRAYVTVFNYMYNNNGYKPAKARMEVVAYNNTKSKAFLTSIGDTNMAEIEGIKVNSSGTNPIMYLGLMTNYKSTSKRSTNILKYTY